MENKVVSRSGQNPVREKWMRDIFKKMFEMVGETLTPEYISEPDWYLKRVWTRACQDEFKYWLRRHLRKRMPWKMMSTKRINDEVDWFILSYGWKEEE
jgi:hypothetical protein